MKSNLVDFFKFQRLKFPQFYTTGKAVCTSTSITLFIVEAKSLFFDVSSQMIDGSIVSQNLRKYKELNKICNELLLWLFGFIIILSMRRQGFFYARTGN